LTSPTGSNSSSSCSAADSPSASNQYLCTSDDAYLLNQNQNDYNFIQDLPLLIDNNNTLNVNNDNSVVDDAETEELLNNIELMLKSIQENPSAIDSQNLEEQIKTFNSTNKANKIIILNSTINNNNNPNNSLSNIRLNLVKTEPRENHSNLDKQSIELANSKELGFKRISPKKQTSLKPIDDLANKPTNNNPLTVLTVPTPEQIKTQKNQNAIILNKHKIQPLAMLNAVQSQTNNIPISTPTAKSNITASTSDCPSQKKIKIDPSSSSAVDKKSPLVNAAQPKTTIVNTKPVSLINKNVPTNLDVIFIFIKMHFFTI
jgi:hypothetical protein